MVHIIDNRWFNLYFFIRMIHDSYYVVMGAHGSKGDAAQAGTKPMIHLAVNWSSKFKGSKHSPAIQLWANTYERIAQ